MSRDMTKMIRKLFIAAFVIMLFPFFIAKPVLSAPLGSAPLGGTLGEGGELCLSSKETEVILRLDISDNDFVTGDFCIDGCGCGTILGEAHIADFDGISYGTIDLYADLPEVCAYGVWYSIDMPSLSHIWYYTGLTSAQYSGTGEFEEISCSAFR